MYILSFLKRKWVKNSNFREIESRIVPMDKRGSRLVQSKRKRDWNMQAFRGFQYGILRLYQTKDTVKQCRRNNDLSVRAFSESRAGLCLCTKRKAWLHS